MGWKLALEDESLLRKLKRIDLKRSSRIIIDDREFILLSSNDYLGLSNHPKLIESTIEAVRKYGVGTGASRLVSGNLGIHEELEERIAGFKGTESAIVFSSGYLANLGVISTLMDKGDLIICDRLNHASIIDGCRLSRAELYLYRHKDISQIEKILSKKSTGQNSLIITDGVFSMDGDIAPLKEIVAMAVDYSSHVMVDDAHATGVLGLNGRGTAEHFGIKEGIAIQMGTFGKAFGTMGAYIAGSKDLINLLINRCRPFIYTTSLPPHVIASTITAIDIIENEPELRKRLWENREYFCKGIKDAGFNTMESETPIIPILIGEAKPALEMAEKLLEQGIFAPAIRPPTVPKGKSRLRTSVMATHTKEDLTYVVDTMSKIGKELGII